MAISTYTSLLSKVNNSIYRVPFTASITTAAVGLARTYAGVTTPPATNATCTNATTGALVSVMPPTATGNLYFAGLEFVDAVLAPASLILVDRLVHTTGIDATLTTTQTTNLPTPSLPARAGNGDGVRAAIMSWGGTSTGACQISYTSSPGSAGGVASGRASRLTAPNVNITAIAGQHYHFPLNDGDVGLSAVANFSSNSIAYGTGTHGIVLYRVLAYLTMRDMGKIDKVRYYDAMVGQLGCLVKIDPTACLELWTFGTSLGGSGTAGTASGVITLIEG